MERLASVRSRWQYTFSTRTDDGSTIEIDGRVVVDNGGVHRATRRTATIAMTRGLHRIRVRFQQATDVYEFYASWTPPGDDYERRSRRSNCSSANHLPSSCS